MSCANHFLCQARWRWYDAKKGWWWMQKANSKRDLHSQITFQKCISSTCRIIKKPVLFRPSCHALSTGSIPKLHQQNNWVGGVKKWAFWLTFSTVFMLKSWDPKIVGGWVRKSPKICWHNAKMVPHPVFSLLLYSSQLFWWYTITSLHATK